MKRNQFINSFLKISSFLLVLILLSGCQNQPIETPEFFQGIDQPIYADDMAITVQEARIRRNYQTYYIMNHAKSGHLFYEVIITIDGAETPEEAVSWGKENLLLVSSGQPQELVLARQIIIGDDVEYKFGEDFQYQYVFIFDILENTDLNQVELQLSEGQTIELASILEGVEGLSALQTPTGSPGPGAIVAGEFNHAGGSNATVSGGSNNRANATHATVCGGELNTASSAYTSITGGRENTAENFYATIGGGYANTASGRDSTISGGSRNIANSHYAVVGGGIQNLSVASNTTIAGGAYNHATDVYATICGGTRNVAEGYAAIIAGGAGNQANGDYAIATGGLNNHALANYAVINGGYANTATGAYAAIPGGAQNEAGGDYSFAAGNHAIIDPEHSGVFLFADSLDVEYHSITPNEFAVRASGGVRFTTSVGIDGAPLTGVYLHPGSGSWSSLSDRSMKTNVASIDGSVILDQLSAMPIQTWSYIEQDPSIRHIGPIAQDFYASFGLGEDDRFINSVDADGVALAAIQSLYDQLKEKEMLINDQQQRLDILEQRISNLEQISPKPGNLLSNPWIVWIILVSLCIKQLFHRITTIKN